MREMATWWLLNRLNNDWADHNLLPALRTAGIYDPDAVVLQESVVPPPPDNLAELAIADIVRLTGDAARGKVTANRCVMCHAIDGVGAELGPASTDGAGASRPR